MIQQTELGILVITFNTAFPYILSFSNKGLMTLVWGLSPSFQKKVITLIVWVISITTYQSNQDMLFYSFHIIGPTLPFNHVYDSAMAESPDGDGVLMFGGQTGHNPNKIIELRAGANSWTILNQTLKYVRAQHTVIPIP